MTLPPKVGGRILINDLKTKHMMGKKITIGLAALVLVVGIMVVAPITANAAIINSSTGNLGDLFVLSRLFGDNDTADLGDIFILDQLFSSDKIVDNGGIIGGSSSSLGELFVLSRLFGDNDTADLGDIFILDQLFDG